MEDYILRVTAGDGAIRGFFATTKNIANKSYEVHNTSPVVSVAMARALTITTIMGLQLKGDKDLITMQIKADGPMGGLLITSDSNGNVKGYPYNNYVDIPNKPSGNVNVGGAIGYGILTITKDMGLKDPYSGQMQLISGEIADDLTYYFSKSEQIPTSIALGALIDKDFKVKQSGGFMIQTMPFCDQEIVGKIEQKLPHLKPISAMLEDGLTPEDIAEIILGDIGLIIHEKIPVKYSCNCSREKVEQALYAISKKDLATIIEEDKKATLNCHFCNTNYDFNEDELFKILSYR